MSAPRWESCRHPRPEEARPRRGSSRAGLLGAADSPPCTWALPMHQNAAPHLPCAPTRGPPLRLSLVPLLWPCCPLCTQEANTGAGRVGQRVKMSPEADGNLPSPRQFSPSPNLPLQPDPGRMAHATAPIQNRPSRPPQEAPWPQAWGSQASGGAHPPQGDRPGGGPPCLPVAPVWCIHVTGSARRVQGPDLPGAEGYPVGQLVAVPLWPSTEDLEEGLGVL